jgi:NTE family protein
MIAFVLSGAANFGALQAGALEVLLEHGIKPEMVVGSSAGALNAIHLAHEPTLDGAATIQDLWRQAGPKAVGVPKAFTAIRNLARQRDSLVDNTQLVTFLKHVLPQNVDTFGQLGATSGVRAFAVAVEMDSGSMRVFGDDGDDQLLDGAMASTAIPPYFPPWEVARKRYLDGGIYSKLPLYAAIMRGATQIIGIDVSYAMGSLNNARGVMGISGYALSLMVERQTASEIAWSRMKGIELRLLRLEAPADIPFWDYSQADRMIEIGREEARKALMDEPIQVLPKWRLRMRKCIANLRSGGHQFPPEEI